MGYNSVFFVMHDFANDLRRHPEAAAELLNRAQDLVLFSKKTGSGNFGNPTFRAIAHGKDLHPQALTAVACMHSSDKRFFVAGGNCMRELPVYDPALHGNKRTVTLVID